MMKNLVWNFDLIDISNTFPQSFDLSDFQSEEMKNFREDMKFGEVIACLNRCV